LFKSNDKKPGGHFSGLLDKYPTGQEGALFQYDQSMIDMMAENLIELLVIRKEDISEKAAIEQIVIYKEAEEYIRSNY